MKKLLIGFVLCFGMMFGQGGVPTISPGSITTTVDKATEESKALDLITVGSSAAGFFAYKVWVPSNMQPHLAIDPQVGMSLPNGISTVQVVVKPKNLDVGTYYFPIVMEGAAGNPYSVSTHITLNVIDSLGPVSTDPVESDRMVPHVAAGGGWTTVIRLYNPTNGVIKQHVKFYSSLGKPMQFMVNGWLVTEQPVIVLPKTITEYTITSNQPLQQGTAVFKMIEGPVPAMNVIYRQASPVRETAVAISTGTDTAMVKFDNRERKSTGLVIGNFGKDLQEVQIEVYDKHGIKKEVKFVQVPVMGSVVFATDQQYASLDEQEGSLIVKGVGKWLSVYAIQFDLTAETFSTEPGM